MKHLSLYSLFFPLSLFSAPTPLPTPIVFINQAKTSLLFDKLTYPAKILPKIEANILSEIDGMIEKLHTPLGHKVKKGQLLITLKHTDPVFQYAPVHLRAPVDGIISQIDFTEGSRITRGQKIITVIDPTSPRIIIELAASDLNAIHQNMKGLLSPVGHDAFYEVTVVGISPFIDSGSGTATSELSLTDKKNVSLPPGLMGKVSFQVRERKGIELPESAILFKGKDTLIRVIEKDMIQISPVKLGILKQGQYEILEGIKEGQTIVVRSSQFVGAGQKVVVQSEEAPQFE